ncbi:hypothetical protein EON82_06750 [bacterium]|nr:MAG: hypothetical protein EON82_06750 [bacterium]
MNNRLARYVGEGRVEIVEEPLPSLPSGGLIVRTEACGLCSGELMSWYMDRKLPHVLGHEVAGIVEQSEDARFPVGSRVFPHHHAPCGQCERCESGRGVHCPTWRSTKLLPGGMADRFAVAKENLSDTHVVDDLRAVDAALIEPLACVCKSVRGGGRGKAAVIGLGVMGLMHMLLLEGATGLDLSPGRRDWASELGLDARSPEEAEDSAYDAIFVCPGSQVAFETGLRLAAPGATITMFAPLGPGEDLRVPQAAYFNDLTIRNAYSAAPHDTLEAIEALRAGKVRAEQVCSEFISLGELPEAYGRMKRGEILKPMVVW